MKLVSDIINELMDSEKSVTGPLLKTKVLASRLKSEELATWVNNELHGYRNDKSIPIYRKFYGDIIGSYLNGRTQYKNVQMPLPYTDNETIKKMCAFNLQDSISTLEALIEQNENGTIALNFPENAFPLWENAIRKNNPYFHIISAYKRLSIGAVVQVVTVVRSKLLDFMLKIDEQFGNLTEIESQQIKSKQIQSIMSQTIINNTGDGNIVNAGDHANINAEINITKGDKKALGNKLKAEGLDQADVEELFTVIDDEQPNGTTFGKKVNEWMLKMISKAANGSWQVGIGAAGTLLAEALKKYYGG